MAKGSIRINIDKCKGCELCVASCPKKILKIHDTTLNAMGHHPVSVTDKESCTGCGICGLMCPDGVISVYRED
jgi:2-oxoglutarate ferredoxin oxidoreductase subunit delta